ncbi:MAG TPA: Mut7-C RNAse domain-containing protein [Bryobacteraceae bacterium]|nr:Mut7-C RNAse domain-containing protein [Bryobacteraceae bacterium]
MPVARFRFYAELNDFLPPERRARTFEHPFLDRASVKDMVEAFGVPHTEVDLILANGEPVDFAYVVRDGDRISVYPMFEALDIGPVTRVRPQPLRDPRFVLDTHLGRLAGYLRMMGFDTLYRNDYGDEELARISREERRILLTRDRGLLKRGAVTHGSYVRETAVRGQLAEVLRRFDLFRAAHPFRLCMRCNTALEPAARDQVLDRLPPRAAELYHDFLVCPGCRRIYWKGGHYERMRRFIESIHPV